jgi:PAS domain S-box-containing protein
MEFTASGGILVSTKMNDQNKNILGIYEAIIQNTPDLIYAFDLNYRFVYANDALLKMWGRTKEESIGKSLLELGYEPWHAEMHECEIDQVVATKAAIRGEVSFPHATLGRRIYDYIFAPVFNEKGDVISISGTTRDISEIRHAQENLKVSEIRFRNMVKQAPVGITILRGPQHIVELANDDYLKLVGRNETEFVGKPLFEVLPEVEGSVRDLLNNVLRTGMPYHGNEVPIPLTRDTGQETGHFDFLYYPLKEEDGHISGIIVTVTEVTEKVEGRKKTEQNEERLNIVVDASELGTWELNLKTMVPKYSDKYLQIIGGYKNRPELTHPQLLKHLHPDDLQMREEAFKKALATGTLYYEARLIWNDNSIHWMQAKGKVLYDSNNLPDKMIGTIRDITEEKTHQQQLEESEQRFRNLILQSPVAKAILKGKDHIVEMANEAILKNIWRKEESEVLGKSILDIFPELKDQKYHQLLDEVFLSGKKHTGKESLISLNGNDGVKYYYVDFEYAPVYSSGNIISGIKITAVDVTEKVEARKIVEENEERFRTLAQTLPQLTWVTDAKGNSEFASSRWMDYSGIEPRGVSEWNSIVHPDDRDRINTVWMHSLATGNIYIADVRLKRKDGEYRWHSVKGEPVFDKNNKIIKWVGAFTEIHEQKMREERKDEFISIASHEMKTPLTTAKAYLQMLEGLLDEGNPDAKLYAQKASQSVNRLNELIGELLDVSKIRLGKLNYTISTFNFNELIASTVENMQLTSQSHTIIKTGSVKDNVSGDKERLQQVIINLLSNAIKYSPGEKEVFVSIAQDGDSIKVSVKDNGIGIASENLNKIFEKYHRIEDHAVQFQGLGIGLFISYEIIQRHNGKLWAESEPGKGSVFHFRIPISFNI